MVGLSWSLHFVSFNHAKDGALWIGCIGLSMPFVFRPRNPLAGLWVWLPAWCGVLALGFLSLVRAEVPWLAVESFLRAVALLAAATTAFEVGRTEAGRRLVCWTVVGTATVAALLALGQRGGLLEAVFPPFSHYDQIMYSVFGNTGLLGGFLALGLVLLTGLLNPYPRTWGGWLLAAGAGGTMAVAFLYSASRGAHVALLMGLAVYLVGTGLLVTLALAARAAPRWKPRLIPVGIGGWIICGLVAAAPSI